jgi:hypothetical protein
LMPVLIGRKRSGPANGDLPRMDEGRAADHDERVRRSRLRQASTNEACRSGFRLSRPIIASGRVSSWPMPVSWRPTAYPGGFRRCLRAKVPSHGFRSWSRRLD